VGDVLGRLLQITLMMGGICLLILVGMMDVLRRQPSGAAWMIYKTGATVFRATPDGMLVKRLFTAQQYISQAIQLPHHHQMLFLVAERDQMGREYSVIYLSDSRYRRVDEILRVHDQVDVLAVSNDGTKVYFQTKTVTTDIFELDWRQRRVDNLTNTPSTDERFLDMSPNGRWILFIPLASNNRRVHIYATHLGTTARLIQSDHNEGTNFIAFSRDSEWVYLHGFDENKEHLVRTRIATGETDTVFESDYSFRAGAWSCDGRYLPLMLRQENGVQITLFDASDAGIQPQQMTSTDGRLNNYLDWSPDGEWIIYVSIRENDSTFDFFRIRTDGSAAQRLPSFEGFTSYRGQSSDGQWFIFSVDDERSRPILFGINLDQKLQYQLTMGNDYPVFETWSPDGEWVYFVGGSNGDRQLYRVQIDGSHRQQLTYHERGADFLLWSPIIDKTWNATRLITISVALLTASIGIMSQTHRTPMVF
jgi:Tol biopolymer transport system component